MTESAQVFRYRRDEVMVSRARTDVRESLLGCRVPPDVVDDLAIVVAELVTNAVEYGDGPSVTVEVAVRAGVVTLAVDHDGDVDLGEPSDWVMPPPGSISGRGLALVRKLVDHVEWSAVLGRLQVRIERRFGA
jgi:anti-sigma regulatory factor (Ser/Thr protein kinase)